MRARLESLHSPDIDIETYWPEDEKIFGFLVEATIGQEDRRGGDLFQIMVCSPDWLKTQHQDRKAMWGRHMLIVFEYDLDAIKGFINSYVEQCSGDNWLPIAQKLNRVASWEFEDYQHYKPHVI